MLDRVTGIALRRPRAVVLLVLLSLIPALLLAARLAIETSFMELLPETAPAVRDLQAGLRLTGGSAFTLVAIGAPDRTTQERFADALTSKLEGLDIVRYAEGRIPIEFIRDRSLLYLSREKLEGLVEEVEEEIDRRKLRTVGLDLDLDDTTTATTDALDLEARFSTKLERPALPFKEYRVGNDGRYLYVFVSLRGHAGDLAFGRRAEAQVEAAAHDLKAAGGFPPELELRFAGPIVIRLEEDRVMKSDLQRASVIGFVSVVLLLVLYTRRLRVLLLLGGPLFVGLAFTLAFALVTFGRLNIISGFLISILSGLGIEYGIHLLFRYLEQRSLGEDVDAAMRSTTATTGRWLVASAMVNSGAFFVVALAKFQGFNEFGLIAGAGMLLTLGVTLIAFPALTVALERWRPMRVDPYQPRAVDAGPLRMPALVRWLVLAFFPIMGVIAVQQLAAGRVRFHTNWRELKGESPASDFDDYVYKSLGMTFTQSLILVPKMEQISEVVAAIESVRAKRLARGAPFGVHRALSLLDVIPSDQEQKLPLIAELKRQLDRIDQGSVSPEVWEKLEAARRLTQVRPFTLDDVPMALKQRFLPQDGGATLVAMTSSYRFHESDELASWAEQMSDLRAELDRRGLPAIMISENWIAGTVFQIINSDGPLILGGTFLVVFLVLLVDFRRVGHALLVLGALAIGQLSLAGVMGLMGMELNILNSAVLPILVGISIDNAVHIFHRYLQEGPASIPAVFRTTARATLLSSATNMLGFGAMIVAHNAGLASVGYLAILGITLTFLSTSVFFPLALDALGRRGERRAAHAPTATSTPPNRERS
ncbi:MAG: MMPL family transporter [Deltaproteobacteria bacterium]|nr:MMPL family transporter [Deltaproteobacteria bacterium]